MNARELLAAAQTLVERAPDAQLATRGVGSLTLLNGDGVYIGWLDLVTGEVTLFEQR
jgi:hypothetical protein